MRALGDLERIHLNSVRIPSFYLHYFELSLKEFFVGLSEGDGRAMVVLEVEIDAEGVLADNFVVNEGLDEGGAGIHSNSWERKTYETLWLLKILRSSVGH